MSVIGITGGIASGKSTFCRMLACKIDAEIFDADAEAKMLLERDPDVREAVTKEISSAAYGENGLPDRAEIRRVIFADAAAKGRLEGILHPRVRARWMTLAAEKGDAASPLLVDIPLLFDCLLYTSPSPCCLKTIWNRIFRRSSQWPVPVRRKSSGLLPVGLRRRWPSRF